MLLDDKTLIEKTDRLVKAEKELLTNVLNKLCDLALKPKSVSKHKSRIIKSKAQIYREVRNRKQCELCSSRFHLQVDHIIPKGKGGPDTEKNLRLLCRPCNQREAIKDFGQKKMDLFLFKERPKSPLNLNGGSRGLFTSK